MGLANLIYTAVRNDQLDEERKRNAELQLAAQMRAEQRAEQDRAERENKRYKVEQGYRDLADLDQQISDTDLQKNVLEQSLSQIQDPMEMHELNVEIKALGNRSKSLEKMRNLREAMLPYEMVDAGIAKAKAVDLVDAANGLRPQRDTGMATVRRENIIGYDQNDEAIKETMTFKIPYTQGWYRDWETKSKKEKLDEIKTIEQQIGCEIPMSEIEKNYKKKINYLLI